MFSTVFGCAEDNVVADEAGSTCSVSPAFGKRVSTVGPGISDPFLVLTATM